MTRAPRATLGQPVDVAMAKPRTPAQLLHDKDAVRVRTHVVESLTASVHRTPRRRPVVEPEVPRTRASSLAPAPDRSQA